MTPSSDQTLENAVARNAAVILSLPSAGMLRHHKSRFLSDCGPEGLWLESVPAERLLIKELIKEGKPCGVSFKLGDKKIAFAARLLRLDQEYRVNANTVLEAVAIDRPPEMRAIQRRNNYRAKIPPDCGLTLRIWRISEQANVRDRPKSEAEVKTKLRDLSLGGIGATCFGEEKQKPKIVQEERVRVSLQPEQGQELILEGRVRSLRADPLGDGSAMIAGVQFLHLQEGLEGRRITAELTKLVGALQMEEVRRHRLGLDS